MFQRLNLTKPIDGRFGERAVTVLDVSGNGAQISSESRLDDGARDTLRFTWRGEAVEVEAEVVRADDHHIGLQFTGESEMLRRLLAASVLELLQAQEANAGGDRARNIIAGDATLTAASELQPSDAFVSYRLGDDGWKRRRSLLPDQPDDGFTIRASVPQDEVDLLCRTYEMGDAEARRLTRLMAELSVARR
jgi:hypothetical protein